MTTRLLVLPSAVDAPDLVFVKVPRPRQGQGGCMTLAYDVAHDGLYELRAMGEEAEDDGPKRSWFVGDEVVSDGRLFVLTPLDPYYLVLPILAHEKGALMYTWDDYLERYCNDERVIQCTDSAPERLLSSFEELGQLPCVKERLHAVCTSRDVGDEKVYRLDPAKCQEYLAKKLEKMTARSAQSVLLTRAVQERAQKLETTDENVWADLCRWECAHLVAQYLDLEFAEPWIRLDRYPHLQRHLEQRRVSWKESMPDFNALDYNAKYMSSNATKKTKVGPSSKQKAEPKGMKSINSFFKAK